MSRPPRPGAPIRPAPESSAPSRPQPLLPSNVSNVRLVPIVPIYARSYAPAPFISIVQPVPRIFTHNPVLTSPQPISASQENRTLTPPTTQSPVVESQHSRISPSPTLTSVSSTNVSSISKEDTVSYTFYTNTKKWYDSMILNLILKYWIWFKIWIW